MAAIAWTADKLVTGEFASPHMMQVRNLLESAPGLTYRYPMDHGGANAGADEVALRGTLDMRPGGRALKFAMTTIDNDLAQLGLSTSGIDVASRILRVTAQIPI